MQEPNLYKHGANQCSVFASPSSMLTLQFNVSKSSLCVGTNSPFISKVCVSKRVSLNELGMLIGIYPCDIISLFTQTVFFNHPLFQTRSVCHCSWRCFTLRLSCWSERDGETWCRRRDMYPQNTSHWLFGSTTITIHFFGHFQ